MSLPLKHLSLKNFRIHKEIDIEFSSKQILIEGDNGVGKTSILESIYFLATTKSPRTADEKDLIKNFCPFTKVIGTGDCGRFEIVLSRVGKRVFKNRVESLKISDYIGGFSVIMFFPEDLNLIKGTPSDRRLFMDLEFVQLDKEYLRLLVNYKKVLKQRNGLLKQMKLGDDLKLLNILGDELLSLGIKIADKRSNYLKLLNIHLKTIYRLFTANEVELVYDPNVSALEFENWIKTKQHQDILLKTTSSGVHKDDFYFKFNGLNAKSYASQGEQRLIVICLKMALIRVIKQVSKRDAILLLDDVLSELDKNIQEKLLNNLPEDNMIIMTSATKFNLSNNTQVIKIEKEKKNG